MDNLEEIDKKLLDVVDSILDFGQILPRPENLITKTEHLFQFAIPKTDHVYLRVRSTIERVVKRNIDNTRKCLKIYKKYEFLLGQIRVLEQWIS